MATSPIRSRWACQRGSRRPGSSVPALVLALGLAACDGASPGNAVRIEPARVPATTGVLPLFEARPLPGYVDLAEPGPAARLDGIDALGGGWTAAQDDAGTYGFTVVLPVWEEGPHMLLLRGVWPAGAAPLELFCDGAPAGLAAAPLDPTGAARLELPAGSVRPPAARIEVRSRSPIAGALGPPAAVRLRDLALVPAGALSSQAADVAADGALVLQPGTAYHVELGDDAVGLALSATGEPSSRAEVRLLGADAEELLRATLDVGAEPDRKELRAPGAAFAGVYVPSDSGPVALLEAAAVGAQRLPNVVLVIVDTLRADAAFGPDGEGLHPSLEALGEDGVVFTRCYSHAPMTLSAHAALFSSRPPFESRVLKNGDRVPEDLPLLAEALADAGFATAANVAIAPLHPQVGPTGELDGGLARGFQMHAHEGWGLAWAEALQAQRIATLDALGARRPLFLFEHYSDPHAPYRGHGEPEVEVELRVDGARAATISATLAVQWTDTLRLAPGTHALELVSDSPFSVNVLQCRVGGRTLAVEEQGEDAQRALYSLEIPAGEPADVFLRIWIADLPEPSRAVERYHGEVAYVDAFIGDLVAELKARDLYDDSLIVFTSDHGEGLWEHGWLLHAENVYDELLHVPLVIKLPKGAAGEEELRAQRHALVRHVDVVPTLLEVLGLPPLPGQRGASLFHPAERVLVASTAQPIAKRDLVCLRDERYKLIYDAGARTFEMYDLVADPDETDDVFASASHEREAWIDHLQRIGAILVDLNASDAALEIDEDAKAMLGALGYLDD